MNIDSKVLKQILDDVYAQYKAETDTKEYHNNPFHKSNVLVGATVILRLKGAIIELEKNEYVPYQNGYDLSRGPKLKDAIKRGGK